MSNMMSTRDILNTIKLSKEPDVTPEIKKLVDKVNQDRLDLKEIDVSDIKMIKALKKKQKVIEKARVQVKTIDPEDLDIIRENYEAREFFSPAGIKNLYMAICNQAVHDYKQTSKYIAKGSGTAKDQAEAEQLRDDAKKFFGEPLFKNVTGMQDPKKTEKLVIKQMQIEATNRMKMMNA